MEYKLHLNTNLRFRKISEDDLAFLLKVYHSTRVRELNMLPWTQAQKEQFITQQFQAQHSYYQKEYPDAAYDIIQFKNQDIGRLYLHERTDEFRIIDIGILPEYQRKGIGTHILKTILEDAANKSKAVRIHVEKNNPALQLYTRLRFREIEDKGVYLLMEWKKN